MSCDPIYSAQEVMGTSIENEVVITLNCLPNLLKTVVFGIYCLVHFLLFLIFLGFLIWEFKGWSLNTNTDTFKRNLPKSNTPISWKSQWDMRKRIFANLLLYSAAGICLFAIFLSGKFTAWRYVLWPILQICPILAGTDLIQSWFRAAHFISHHGHKADTYYKNDQKMLIFLIYMIILFVGLIGIGPIIAFYVNNAVALNWCFVMGYFHQAVCGFVVSVYTDFYGTKLIKSVQPAMVNSTIVDKDVSLVYHKVKTFTKLTRLSLLGPIIFLFVPIIWLGVTQTSSNPGLPNFFYFIFFIDFPGKISWVCLLAWFAHTKSKYLNSREPSHIDKAETKITSNSEGRFPSFSIEELNSIDANQQ